MSNAFPAAAPAPPSVMKFSGEPVFMNHCQCQDCQRRSGTGHGSYLTFMGRKGVNLEGKAAHCDVVADSGNVKTHGFCPACGVPVYLTFAAMPDLFTVHAASLDDPGRFKPQAVTYRVRGHAWDHLDSDLADIRQDATCCQFPEPAYAVRKLSGACRLWRFPFVLNREAPKRRFVMDHSRYRWVIVAAGGTRAAVGIGGDVFAASAAAIDRARYQLVGRRGLERDDDRFSGDGVLQHALGHVVGPLRAATGGADGIDGAGGKFCFSQATRLRC